MGKESLKFSALTDSQIILAASQLATAACASLPHLDDEQHALERAQDFFEQCCADLLAKRANETEFLAEGMDLS